MELFYGKAGLLGLPFRQIPTDHAFHAMGVPQLGPGKADRFESHAAMSGGWGDEPRRGCLCLPHPALRNVTATGPWGHAGAFSDLGAFLRHHADPAVGMTGYEPQATLPAFEPAENDWALMDRPEDRDAIGRRGRRGCRCCRARKTSRRSSHFWKRCAMTGQLPGGWACHYRCPAGCRWTSKGRRDPRRLTKAQPGPVAIHP